MNERDIMKSFATNLRARRKALHLTQKEFGDIIGYSEKSVSKWESESAVAPSVVLPLIAATLKTTVDDLFRGSDGPLYYLGIHGGGSLTEFLLTDRSGEVIGRTQLAGCSPVDVGLAKTFEVLEEGICTVCSGIKLSQVSVYAGLSGGMTGDYQEKIASFLKRFGFIAYGNGGIAEIALSTTLGDSEGVVVIVGTGSVAYARTRDRIHRIGGYGYLFEDGAGNYGIGKACIQVALEEEARGRGESILLQKVRQMCGTARVEDSLKAFYLGGKSTISSYASAAFDAHHMGDPEAERILRDAAAAIAKLVIRAQEMFDGRCVPSVIAGDFVKRSSVLLPMVKEVLPIHYVHRLTIDEQPLIWGALQMAGLPEACIATHAM